jgi:hypothetical protein
MNCCDEYGNCRQGRDCPVRQATPTSPKAKSHRPLVLALLLGSAAVSISILYGLWWLAGVV